MKGEFTPSTERVAQLEAMTPEWQKAYVDVVTKVGDSLGSDGQLLAMMSHVVLVEGEDHFKPWPEVKWLEGDVEVVCNLEGFDIWERVLSYAPSISPDEVRDLYLGTAASSVELSFLAFSASRERDVLDPKVRSRSVARAGSIIGKLHDKEELLSQAEKFERKNGKAEITNAIMTTLTDSQILELNKFRYGLGTAMFALGLTPEKQQEIIEAFGSSLVAEIVQHEETLLIFLEEFASANPVEDIVDKYRKARKLAFQEFLFGGTIPMGYS